MFRYILSKKVIFPMIFVVTEDLAQLICRIVPFLMQYLKPGDLCAYNSPPSLFL